MSNAAVHDCGLGPAILVLAGKWRPTIIWSLQAGPVRFGALRRRVAGISEKVLFEELRALELLGLVHREAFDERRLRVEYSLTTAGVELGPAVYALAEWGKRHFEIVEAAACVEQASLSRAIGPDDQSVEQPEAPPASTHAA